MAKKERFCQGVGDIPWQKHLPHGTALAKTMSRMAGEMGAACRVLRLEQSWYNKRETCLCVGW